MKKTFLFFILLLVSYSNYAQIDFQILWTGYTVDNTLVEYSPDGNIVLTYTPANSLLKVYDANSGAQIWANPDIEGDYCRFSPDGSKVVGINSFGDLCIYNSYTGALIWKDTLYSGGDYIMSPNSNYIIRKQNGFYPARLFNLNNGNIIWTKNECDFPINISFDNTKFSYQVVHAGTTPDSIIIADLITGNQIWNKENYYGGGFSPDNNFFVTSIAAGIGIFDCNTGILSSTIPDNDGSFVKYSEDNLKIFCLHADDGELYCYNAQTHILMCVISNQHFFHNYWYETIFTDSLSNKVAIFGDYSGFGVFNTNNGILIGSDNVSQQFSSITNPIYLTNLALSPDGTKIFTAEEELPSYSHTVKMWSINATGISNITNQNSFYKIYPVPVAQNLSIEIMNKRQLERIELFDLQGKLLSTQNSEGKKFSLDVHSLISGTYLLKIIYDDGKIDLEKFIKE